MLVKLDFEAALRAIGTGKNPHFCRRRGFFWRVMHLSMIAANRNRWPRDHPFPPLEKAVPPLVRQIQALWDPAPNEAQFVRYLITILGRVGACLETEVDRILPMLARQPTTRSLTSKLDRMRLAGSVGSARTDRPSIRTATSPPSLAQIQSSRPAKNSSRPQAGQRYIVIGWHSVGLTTTTCGLSPRPRFGLPISSGTSRHGAPVRRIQRIPP